MDYREWLLKPNPSSETRQRGNGSEGLSSSSSGHATATAPISFLFHGQPSPSSSSTSSSSSRTTITRTAPSSKGITLRIHEGFCGMENHVFDACQVLSTQNEPDKEVMKMYQRVDSSRHNSRLLLAGAPWWTLFYLVVAIPHFLVICFFSSVSQILSLSDPILPGLTQIFLFVSSVLLLCATGLVSKQVLDDLYLPPVQNEDKGIIILRWHYGLTLVVLLIVYLVSVFMEPSVAFGISVAAVLTQLLILNAVVAF